MLNIALAAIRMTSLDWGGRAPCPTQGLQRDAPISTTANGDHYYMYLAGVGRDEHSARSCLPGAPLFQNYGHAPSGDPS